jgi:hypothetical protein
MTEDKQTADRIIVGEITVYEINLIKMAVKNRYKNDCNYIDFKQNDCG